MTQLTHEHIHYIVKDPSYRGLVYYGLQEELLDHCMVIVLFVVHELSYDRFHERANRIYRVDNEFRVGCVYHHLALGSAAMVTLFAENYPEIESVVRIQDWGNQTVRHPDRTEEDGEKKAWA